jgi:hypothetical protein
MRVSQQPCPRPDILVELTWDEATDLFKQLNKTNYIVPSALSKLRDGLAVSFNPTL